MFLANIVKIGIFVNRKQERLSRMIVNYLRRNPNAGDTLEGITKWWLELERIDTSVDDIAYVVNDLTQRGIIRMHKTQGIIFYKIDEMNDLTGK